MRLQCQCSEGYHKPCEREPRDTSAVAAIAVGGTVWLNHAQA